jgi:branched-chain amino acid transport system permease protein
LKADRLITPLAFLVITFGVVFIPAERSGWDFDGVVSNLTAFLTIVAIFSMMTVALNVQWGYAGVFNFGIAAFFMLGAYTAAIFTLPPAEGGFETYVGGFGPDLDVVPALGTGQWLPFVLGMAAAALVCGVLAFLVSIPTLNLRQDYLAIATIGLAELLRNIAVEERDLVNGSRALNGIPQPFTDYVDSGEYKFVLLGLVIGVLVLVFIAVERGIRSPWGRVLRALREDEEATAASGKNVFAFKIQGFVFGAMVMGIGGAVYAFQSRTIAPDTFSHYFATFLFWAMLIVGGSGNNKGAILGAYMIWGFYFVSIHIQGYDLPGYISQTRISASRDVLIGVLIVSVLLLRPQGLIPEERTVSGWMDRLLRRERRHARAKRRGPTPHELPAD